MSGGANSQWLTEWLAEAMELRPALPFAADFFDAVVSSDSFVYYGTDDLYAQYLARFVKPGGQIGMAGAGLTREIDWRAPEHLRSWWEPSMCCLHSAAWWRRYWERSGVLQVIGAEHVPDGWRHWLTRQRAASPNNHAEIQALEADEGRFLGYVRAVARPPLRRHRELPDHGGSRDLHSASAAPSNLTLR